MYSHDGIVLLKINGKAFNLLQFLLIHVVLKIQIPLQYVI